MKRLDNGENSSRYNKLWIKNGRYKRENIPRSLDGRNPRFKFHSLGAMSSYNVIQDDRFEYRYLGMQIKEEYNLNNRRLVKSLW